MARIEQKDTNAPRRGVVVGVMKDIDFRSVYEETGPVVFWSWREKLNFLSVKVQPKGMEETLAHLERQWKRFVPNRAFSYQFLDEKLDGFYAQEYRFARLFRFAFGIAIALASLGLLGLAAFAAERRRKEVGVRKVLGADISSVVGLLTSDFMKPVLLANLIAWPVAYTIAQRWLDSFVYRIDIGIVPFLISAGIAALLAMGTVGYQALRASTADPVDALRYE